jgi:hypothetical protein
MFAGGHHGAPMVGKSNLPHQRGISKVGVAGGVAVAVADRR